MFILLILPNNDSSIHFPIEHITPSKKDDLLHNSSQFFLSTPLQLPFLSQRKMMRYIYSIQFFFIIIILSALTEFIITGSKKEGVLYLFLLIFSNNCCSICTNVDTISISKEDDLLYIYIPFNSTQLWSFYLLPCISQFCLKEKGFSIIIPLKSS